MAKHWDPSFEGGHVRLREVIALWICDGCNGSLQ